MENKENKQAQEAFDPYKPHKIRWWGWPLLAILIAGTIYICKTENVGSGRGESFRRFDGDVFGTVFHITYMSSGDLSEGIKKALDDVDNSLSPFNKQSTISHINDNSSMDTDTMFVKVFAIAKAVAAETDGAFDITVAPLVNLWGFGFKSGEKVSDNAVDSVRRFVGFDKVDISHGKVVKQMPETSLDCSAIAKGFGVDAVAEYLESKGVIRYMVEIGGEVRLRGLNPKNANWSIGVTTPTDDSLCRQDDIQKVIRATDCSMATSGNYRNYYIKGGKKYAHTIDPRTGYPVQHNILSSTVIANDCATADAYATAFMVLGLEEAQQLLKRHNDLEAYFICAGDNGEFTEWHTEGMNDKLISAAQSANN